MLRNNRNSRLQENLFIWKQSQLRKLESCEIHVFVKKWKLLAYHLEDLRVGTSGTRTTGWEPLV